MEDIIRSVAQSKTSMVRTMSASDEHLGGKVHSWVISALVEKIAYECAMKYTDLPCSTVSVDSFAFHSPLSVGQTFHLFASVNYIYQGHLVVGIRGEADGKHICTAFLTMVTRNEQERMRPIPKLLLQTTEDVRRYMEARIRREVSLRSEVTVQQRIHELNIFTALDQVRRDRNVIVDFELNET